MLKEVAMRIQAMVFGWFKIEEPTPMASEPAAKRESFPIVVGGKLDGPYKPTSNPCNHADNVRSWFRFRTVPNRINERVMNAVGALTDDNLPVIVISAKYRQLGTEEWTERREVCRAESKEWWLCRLQDAISRTTSLETYESYLGLTFEMEMTASMKN